MNSWSGKVSTRSPIPLKHRVELGSIVTFGKEGVPVQRVLKRFRDTSFREVSSPANGSVVSLEGGFVDTLTSVVTGLVDYNDS